MIESLLFTYDWYDLSYITSILSLSSNSPFSLTYFYPLFSSLTLNSSFSTDLSSSTVYITVSTTAEVDKLWLSSLDSLIALLELLDTF